MIYEIDLHLFGEKLKTILMEKGITNSKNEPDIIALYNLLYPNQPITQEDCNKDRQEVTDRTRKLANWLKGKNYPKNIEDILCLCNALDCNLDYFFCTMEAPTHDLEFISNTIGLSSKTVIKIIEYEKNIKEIVNCLVNADGIKTNTDLFYSLLCSIRMFGMTRDTSKITIEESLFESKDEIIETEEIKSVLRRIPHNVLDLCLKASYIFLSEDRKQIEELKSKIKDLKIEKLEQEIQNLNNTYTSVESKKE